MLNMKVQFILYLLFIGDKRHRTEGRHSNQYDFYLAQTLSSDSNLLF